MRTRTHSCGAPPLVYIVRMRTRSSPSLARAGPFPDMFRSDEPCVSLLCTPPPPSLRQAGHAGPGVQEPRGAAEGERLLLHRCAHGAASVRRGGACHCFQLRSHMPTVHDRVWHRLVCARVYFVRMHVRVFSLCLVLRRSDWTSHACSWAGRCCCWSTITTGRRSLCSCAP